MKLKMNLGLKLFPKRVVENFGCICQARETYRSLQPAEQKKDCGNKI